MICTATLLEDLSGSHDLIECDFKTLSRSSNRDVAFVINQGELLFTDDRILNTGLTATHKLKRGEPVWFVETLTKGSKNPQFKNISDITLFEVNGTDIRQAVERSGFLSKEIIRYSIARLYGRNQSRRNFTFEDALWRSKDEIDRVYFKQGDIIFDWGDKSEAIFFIVDGQVSVRTLKNRNFAVLSTADSFGEYSLITGKPRTLRATAETDCQLFKLSSEWVLSHLTKEHPFVRLTLHQTLSMLSIQNQMKLIKSNDGVYRNPSEPNEADAE